MTTHESRSPLDAATLALATAGLGAPAAARWANRIELACTDEDDQDANAIYGRVMPAVPRGEVVGPRACAAILEGCRAWAGFRR